MSKRLFLYYMSDQIKIFGEKAGENPFISCITSCQIPEHSGR